MFVDKETSSSWLGSENPETEMPGSAVVVSAFTSVAVVEVTRTLSALETAAPNPNAVSTPSTHAPASDRRHECAGGLPRPWRIAERALTNPRALACGML